MNFKVKAIIVIVAIFVAFISGLLYLNIRQEIKRISNVTGYLAAGVREQVDDRLQHMTSAVARARACAEKSQAPSLLATMKRLDELTALADTGRQKLKTFSGLSGNKEKALASLQSYKNWATSHSRLLSTDLNAALFNTVLNPGDELLPESLSTPEMSALQLQALILEDALITAAAIQVDREMANFGGCWDLVR